MIVYLQPFVDTENMAECNLDFGCKCEDSKNNTYVCLRSLQRNANLLYCQFADDEREFYELREDPYQLHNLVPAARSERDLR